MAIQYSEAARNAQLDALETAIGTGAILKLRTGAVPATVADADAGSVLATFTLPSDWLAAASGGAKGKAGTWVEPSADDTGEAGHFRVYASDGITAYIQGTVTASGGGGDIEMTSISISAGQAISIDSFSITDGNA